MSTNPWSGPGRPGAGRGPGVVGLLGGRREPVAWVLTGAAALVLAGRIVTEFAYPAADGLRYNAIAAGPGLGGVEVLAPLLVAAALAVAAPPSARSRLIVAIDLLLVAVATLFAVVALLLTLAAYSLRGISGLVTGSVLVQLGNLVALVVGAVLVRRALRATPAALRSSNRPGRPQYGAPAPYPPAPYPPAPYPQAPYPPADGPDPYGPGYPGAPRPVRGTGSDPDSTTRRPF